jgi:DNA-binding NtrC family response regulator
MHSTLNAASGPSPNSRISALVVEPEEAARAFLMSTLTAAGLVVTEADGFASGRASLLRRPPSVLLTEIRLGKHNGLHLAHIGRSIRPQMIVVLTSEYRDPVLIRDAEALEAIFIPKPLTRPAVLALVRYIATSGPWWPRVIRERHDPL